MKYFKSGLCILSILVPVTAFCESGFKKGTIEYIRTHDASHGPSWAPPVFWFTLNEVSSAGSCVAWNGNILFVSNNAQAYSMILGAYMAGKEVSVQYDDTSKNGPGYCIATHITLGNPPPLN